MEKSTKNKNVNKGSENQKETVRTIGKILSR